MKHAIIAGLILGVAISLADTYLSGLLPASQANT